MIILYLLSLIPLCLASTPKGVYYPKENGLVVVTDQTSEEIIQHNDLIFLAYGAHWCRMCMRFLLKLEDAIKEVQPEFPQILFAKINGYNNEGVTKNFQSVGFPSYHLVYKGHQLERYHGNFQPINIITWLKNQLTLLGIKVTANREIEDKLSNNDVILVYFGSDKEDLSAITLALFEHRDIPFLIASSDLMKQYHVSNPRTLKILKKYDEKEHELVIKSQVTKEEIDAFIKAYSLPLVMEYDKKAHFHIFRKNSPGLFFLQSHNEQFDKKDMLSLAKAFRGKLNVVLIDSLTSELGKEFADNYNVTESDLPTIQLLTLKYSPKPVQVPKPYDLPSLKRTIDKLLINAPNTANEVMPSSVYILNKANFQKEAIDNDLDVFVKFYAPWCSHCKRLALVYERLAAKFAPNKSIRIAEVDATANSIDNVKVNGYPTLILFPKGSKLNPIYYEGDRKFEDMEKFLHNNAGSLAKQDL